MLVERAARALRAGARGALAAWLVSLVLALSAVTGPVSLPGLALVVGAAALLPLGCLVWVGLLGAVRVPLADERGALGVRASIAVLVVEVAVWAACTAVLASVGRVFIPQQLAHHAPIARVVGAHLAVLLSVVIVVLASRRGLGNARFAFWTLVPLHVLARLFTRDDLALIAPGQDFAVELASVLFCVLAATRWDERSPSARELRTGAPAMLGALLLAFAYALLQPSALSALAAQFPGPASAFSELRAAYDLDGDGFAAVLGGGDCDDDEPLVSPMALELVGNGVDDNCMGGDLQSYLPPASVTRSADAPQHSLVLIVVDTLRADAVAGGKRPAPMPQVDRFARQAAVFERMYAQAPYTTQAMRALMTGYYPMSLSTFEVSLGMEPTLAARLRSVGYQTSAIAQFEEVELDSRASRQVSSLLVDFERVDWSLRARNRDFRGVTSRETTERALAELARLRSDPRPFFLWVHYFDPHAEYQPHAGTPFAADTLAGRYWQEVFATDRELGRLLAELEQSGFYRDGYVVFTSDHGELLGERGRFQHALWLDEEALRVPLVVRGPSVPAGRYRARVRQIDVAPTLLELAAGIRAPSSGRTLESVWRGAERSDRDSVAITSYDRRVIKRAVWQEQWKLELDLVAGSRVLYDLSAAAGASTDVSASHPQIVSQLEQRMGRIWDRAMNDRVLAQRRGQP